MTSISLNGVWKRSVAGGPAFDQTVPYSAFPSGMSDVFTRFDRPSAEGRILLRFDGITYKAWVYVNGEPAGEMLPYSVYVFDITHLLHERDNELCVRIADMRVPFGPSEGWENYGGIIRSVHLDVVPDAYIDDVCFRTDFSEGYSRAHARVSIGCVGAEGLSAAVRLMDKHGVLTAEDTADIAGGACDVFLDVANPHLWSPDDPYLYTLEVTLGEHRKTICVGFKDFRIDGRRFLLNGKPLFLRGVCRHDLWGDDGHTLTEDKILRDLTMIKAAGANFVRLVHYPHDERVLEMADRMGLLVSDEPGLWWSDMHNPAIVDGALKVMEKAILRDRSHVSVAFWLAFNECVFTEEFLRTSVELCRRLDPTRPVSGANCMNLEMTKELFSKCGFDFYTYHPYGTSESGFSNNMSFDDIMDTLCDKPLVFTEWGGYFTEDNNYLFTRFLQKLLSGGKEGRLAGFSYWVWADMYEFGRGEPACIEGKLYEGLVDIHRNIRPMYHTFMEQLTRWDAPLAENGSLTVYPVNCSAGDYECIALHADAPAQQDARERVLLESLNISGFVHKKMRRLNHGPVPPKAIYTLGAFPVHIPAQWPLTVEDDCEISVNRLTEEVSVVWGSMPWGYPTYGELGERMGALIFSYEDGFQDTVELQNGVHIAAALASLGPSRIDPQARLSEPALRFTYDLNWEHYAAGLCRFSVKTDRVLKSVRIVYEKPGALLVFAVTVKKHGDR